MRENQRECVGLGGGGRSVWKSLEEERSFTHASKASFSTIIPTKKLALQKNKTTDTFTPTVKHTHTHMFVYIKAEEGQIYIEIH